MTLITTTTRVASTEQLYGEVFDWLVDESVLLDRGLLSEWLDLLTPDATYQVPVRDIRSRFDTTERRTGEYFHYDETRSSLAVRLRRIAEPTAWAEDPRSTTRHLVSNLRVTRLESGDVLAESYLVLLRHRGQQLDYEILSGERRDVLRRGDDGRLLLASRVVELDRSSLNMVNLAVFL